ncbi:MAG: PEP-CTERM sorting domain-containing protein [Verrucomicrobiota bacterium]
MTFTKNPLVLSILCLITTIAQADVTYDFTGQGGIFDGLTTVDVIVTDIASTTMTVTAAGGNLESNSGDFGVDGTEPGQTNDLIDGLVESITLTFSTVVTFNFIDLGGVGADISDGANITIAGSGLDVFTGVSGFNGTSDIYTPGSPITLSIGESIVVTGSSSSSVVDLEAINLSIVPEPSSFALIGGLLALGFVALRRRSVS